jgi:hypothetical protein
MHVNLNVMQGLVTMSTGVYMRDIEEKPTTSSANCDFMTC